MSTTSSLPTFGSVDKLLADLTAAGKLPATAAVVLDGKGNVLFQSAHGLLDVTNPQSPPMTVDTPVFFFSAAKIVTITAALQLVDQGKLSLDDPVEKYVDGIKEIKVLEGWNEDGSPNTRAPKTTATIKHLLTHTAGFAYEFSNEDACKYRLYQKDIPPNAYPLALPPSFYDVALIADPGTQYQYGISTDWLGFVVEAISGVPLDSYFAEHITGPLGMTNSPMYLGPDSHRVIIHVRMPDGTLVPRPEITAPEKPQIRVGGGLIHSSLNDFSTLLLALLNGGQHPVSGVRVLQPKTARSLFVDHISNEADRSELGAFVSAPSSFPPLMNAHTLLEGVKKGWSTGFMLNLEDVPNGRRKGSGGWVGLGNVFYWLDPTVEGGRIGLLVTGVLPALDPEVMKVVGELEGAVYGGKRGVVE